MVEQNIKLDSDVSNLRPRSAVRDYSARSIISNVSVSSTKTHRRSAIEVSSILFNGLGGARTIDIAEGGSDFTTKHGTIKSRPKSDRGLDQIVSTPCSIQMLASSSDVLESSTDSDNNMHGQGTKLTRESSLCAAALIRELSFSSHPNSISLYEESTTMYNTTHRHEPEPLGAEDNYLQPSTQPLLPPMIRRLEMIHIIDIPSFRTRTRSTSISEMSDSNFHETRDDGDDKSVMSLMQSSSDNHADRGALEKNELSAKGSQNIASCHSSVASSLSDVLLEDNTQFEAHEHDHKDFLSVQKGTGTSSFRCNSSCGGSVLTKPRLTSKTLKEWDMLCEESYPKRDVSSIFRARSISGNTPAAPLPYRGGCVIDLLDDNISVKQSEIRHMMSQSMFSYTNSSSSISTVGNDDAGSILDFDASLIAPIHVPVSVKGSPKRRTV